LGYLNEIRTTSRGHAGVVRPTIDYVKVPRWAFEVPQADRTLTADQSVGEAMAIGRTFKEAFLKASVARARQDRHARSRTTGVRSGRRHVAAAGARHPDRPPDVGGVPRAQQGLSIDEIHRLTHIDKWFLTQFQQIIELGRSAATVGPRDVGRLLRG
jgi:carbamoyl-phosphate synthase large subunit